MAAILTPSGILGLDPSSFRVESRTLSAYRFAPPGMLALWATATAPTGWLICDGSAVSRTTYADLFAVLSTAYGVGDGSTTFNLPDLRGRFPLGKAASGTGSTLGGTGGAIDHSHAVDVASTTSGTGSGALAQVQPLLGGTSVNSDTHTHDTNPASVTSGTANPPFMAVHFIVRT